MPDARDRFEPAEILRVLQRHDVAFVLIGGVSGSLHGSTTLTQGIDIVYARDRANLERLAAALKDLRATLRGAPRGLPFKRDVPTLRAGLNFTFSTPLGPLDCVGEVAGGFTYDRLIGNAESFQIADLQVRAASLNDLIRMKRAAGRPRDLIEVENLAALREEMEKRRR